MARDRTGYTREFKMAVLAQVEFEEKEGLCVET